LASSPMPTYLYGRHVKHRTILPEKAHDI